MLALGAALAIAAMLAAGLVLTGCGTGNDSTVTVTDTVDSGTPSEPPATTGTEPTETTGTEPETGDRGPGQFQLPSGNIGCAFDQRGVRCDIAKRDWIPPPAPADCPVDYGQGISLDGGGAEFVCAGDTVLGALATLDYGSSARRGRFRCDARTSGVTCSSSKNGHGFAISRQEYRIF